MTAKKYTYSPETLAKIAVALKREVDELLFREDGSLNLMSFDLRGKDLSGCDLTGADLTNSLMTGANLLNTNLTGALLNDTRLPCPHELSQATGLTKAEWGNNIAWFNAASLVRLSKKFNI